MDNIDIQIYEGYIKHNAEIIDGNIEYLTKHIHNVDKEDLLYALEMYYVLINNYEGVYDLIGRNLPYHLQEASKEYENKVYLVLNMVGEYLDQLDDEIEAKRAEFERLYYQS